MRIVFFGTPEFAANILSAIAESEYGKDVVGVVTREDKPKNRGHKLCPPPVKVEAEKRGYPVFQPQTLKEEVFGETFRALAPDLCIVAAYGKILPHYVLFEPKYESINVHGSLLPKYRGAAPIQRAIMAGEKALGITIMKMDDGLDTGEMLAKKWILPSNSTSCGEIEERLSHIGAELLLSVIRNLKTEKYPPKKQAGAKSTYASKILPADRALDFSESATVCQNRVRALSPAPLAVATLGESSVKVISAIALDENPTGAPGTVHSLLAKGAGAININCGEGVLSVLRIVPEGKNEMSAGDFIRGRKVDEHSTFTKADLGGEK